MRGPRRWAPIVLEVVLGLALVGCVGTPDPEPPTPPATSPPPAIPRFTGIPEVDDCFPDSAQGAPPFTPVPANVVLGEPDLYAAPYEPSGVEPRRISGRGLAYEVSSRVGLVAGFYATCLDTYATEIDTEQIPTERGDVIFRIPLQGRPPVVVLIAGDPPAPTVVVIFTDYEIADAPRPEPSASPAPGPS